MQSPRILIVMRHGKAEDAGASDAERRLTQTGTADSAAAGSWLAARDLVPDHALVSPAVRTRQTWDAIAAGTDWDVEEMVEESLYETGPVGALDLLRRTPGDVAVLLLVGHNPTVASLAQLIDDGEGDDDAGTDMTLGFPTSAMAVFEYAGEWPDLGEASASLIAFHVGRG